MQKLIYLFSFFLTVPVLFFSCDEKVADDNPDNAIAYYPMQTGKYVIYDVDSTIYNETTPDETHHWQIKEEIVDTFYDLDNILNYRIERYQRINDSAAWALQEVWSVRDVNGSIERDENNLRFVKLISPVSVNRQWNGTIYLGDLDSLPFEIGCNKLSFLEDWDYTYITVDSSVTINDMLFDSTLTVFQQGADNLLELNYAIEVYAKGVGMVKKEFYHYTSQITDDINWEDKVECGYKYLMTVVEFN
ncbi:MAG: hypothetical protein H7Y00_11225 [Fimbriimonadaceae bacterium]|nr:hypothetical protein [Chitinophagales bacterium]